MEATTVCERSECAGCMACVDICPKKAIKVADSVEHIDAVIDRSLCINCGLCYRVCQKNNPAELRGTVESWQGWAVPAIRETSSSGGYASAIMRAFVERGGVVAACRFEKGSFRFALAHATEQLDGFAGSKYVKSDPSGIYRAVRKELQAGKRVLFIGLPCQVSAMRNFIGMAKGGCLSDRLYTIDLICHGTPSMKVLVEALFEYGYDLDNVKKIWFRQNTEFGLRVDARKLMPEGCIDTYTMAFLDGICYTRNCYECDYATGERVGDLTLGDSWGTELKDEEPAGISLALVQTVKGRELLDMAGLELRPVNYANAVASNHQLQYPSKMTPKREKFFSSYQKKGSVKKTVRALWPKKVLKQWAKAMLVKSGMTRKLDCQRGRC